MTRPPWRSVRIPVLSTTGGRAIGSIVLRGLSLLSNLAAVSLALRLLGPERYGEYVLLMAAAAWLALTMLGTTEYFTQLLVKMPKGLCDPAALPVLRATFLYSIWGAVGGSLISVTGLILLIPTMGGDLTLVIAGSILLIGTAASFPLSIASSALVAQGRIGRDALFKLLQPLLLMAMVASACLMPTISSGMSLILLSAAYAISLIVTRFWAFIATFELKPLLADLLSARVALVAGGAFPFLIIQLAALLSFQTDRFLITSFSSLSDLASYDLLSRMFTALYTVFSIPLLNIWRLVGTSWHTGDVRRARRVVTAFTGAAALFWLLATFVIVQIAPFAVAWFSGGLVATPPAIVAVLIGAFFLVRGTTDVLTLSLYAMEEQKRTLAFVVAHGVSNVAFAIFGGQLGGIKGLIAGQIVSFILSTLLPFTVMIRSNVSKARQV